MYNKTSKILIALTTVELLSLSAFHLPQLMPVVFALLTAGFAVLAIYDLRWAALVLLAELFIGSKGYLFFLALDGIEISIRIAFWLVLLSVWLGRLLPALLKNKDFSFLKQVKTPLWGALLALFLFIGWGILNGFLAGNEPGNVFFDLNGWLYFALVFPIYTIFKKNKEFPRQVFVLFLASMLWISFKSLIILYLFSHNFSWLPQIYSWIRDSGVGEITQMESGFVRVFFQAYVFLVPAFLLLWSRLIFDWNGLARGAWLNQKNISVLLMLGLFCSVNLLSLSRSNWMGWLLGSVLLSGYLIYRYRLKALGQITLIGIFCALFGFLLIFSIVKFPIPESYGSFRAGDISDRAGQVSGEAAAASRWALWPELSREIVEAPVLGKGFGETVTYQTQDPRAVAETGGEFTTYAFEWGWLDIWLKLGVFGLLSYLVLIGLMLKKLVVLGSHPAIINISLAAGLLSVVVIHFFSPYLNHPLGIGGVVIIFGYIAEYDEKHEKQ